jgi:hypothetical protein
VKVIFSLPPTVVRHFFGANEPPPQYLAYVEWFTPFDNNPRPNHMLYQVKRVVRNNQRIASIISLDSIRRSVHLIPVFGSISPREWSSSNVLDKCSVFFVNAFADRHSYHTMI